MDNVRNFNFTITDLDMKNYMYILAKIRLDKPVVYMNE